MTKQAIRRSLRFIMWTLLVFVLLVSMGWLGLKLVRRSAPKIPTPDTPPTSPQSRKLHSIHVQRPTVQQL
jgi:hypothetical protein